MLEILAALVLLGHGLGHTTGAGETWTNLPTGFSDRPWIFGRDVRLRSPAGRVFGIVFLVATILFVMSSVAAFTGSEMWRDLALAGSAASIACIVPWWNTVILGARLGVLLDIAIVLVLLVPGGESFVEFFGLP